MIKKTYRLRKVTSIIIAALMLVLSLTSYSSMDADAVNTSLTYNVFNASNGNYMSSYTLAANAVQDNSRITFGNDERVVDFTKSGVVKIVTSAGTFGTGFIIDGHTIVTAAHCVYEKDSDIPDSYAGLSITHIYVFNSNGVVELDITNAYSMHIPTLYVSTAGETNKYDYALITIPEVNTETGDLSEFAIFDLSVMLDGFKNSNKVISTTGFPGEVRGKTVNHGSLHNMYTGTGAVETDKRDPDLQFCYTCDTSGGNSGGPIYTTTSYGGNVYYTVIGIVAGHNTTDGINIATRITTDLLHFYKNNSNIVWE